MSEADPTEDRTLAFYQQRFERPLPDWVFNLLARIAHGFLPTISTREIRSLLHALVKSFRDESILDFSLSPHLKAKLLGHSLAVVVFVRFTAPTNPWAAAALKTMDRKPEQLKRTIDDAINAVLSASPVDAHALLKTFTNAFGNTLDDRGQMIGKNPYWQADFNMLMFWPYVEKLDSIGDLYRFLRLQVGEKHAGQLKRLEALCKSIGLRYRPRGKPGRKPNATK